MQNLYLERVTNSARVPTKATDFSACHDIYADLNNRKIILFPSNGNSKRVLVKSIYNILPSERVMIPTGFKMCCDPGWKIELAPRSGNAIKLGMSLINCTGIVDADYRDEAMILIVNHSNQPVKVTDGMRIAQLSLEKVTDVNIVLGPLPKIDSNRSGGMGSTDE